MELKDIKGVGPKTLIGLNELGIYTVSDLVRYYPYRYNIYKPINITDIIDDSIVTLTGTVVSKPTFFRSNKIKNIIRFRFHTSNSVINVVVFNQPYLSKLLYLNRTITLVGKYEVFKNTLVVNKVLMEPIYNTSIEPVYHSNNDIKRATLIKCIDAALMLENNIKETIPNYLNQRYDFIDTLSAIKCIHNPINTELYKKSLVKLKYEELFDFMFKINFLKFKNQIVDNFVVKNISKELFDDVINLVPFKLTNDQLDVMHDVLDDFNNLKRMNRLVLGDVGSGKTIVAFLSMILNSKVGYQSAMLAPTEVLAVQHYKNFKNTFKLLNLNVALLTGSTTKEEKKVILNNLKNGEIDILIGTHAILEEKVEFNNLGLVVTDEQHRFGVNQRNVLKNKGQSVDVMYMSATPIPRTYALTIYGDMDISLIKEKPAGRKDIITELYKFNKIDEVVKTLEEELINGHQAYVVAPLIDDEEETSELNDLKKIKSILEEHLSNKYKIDILHGKMKSVEKDKVINNFKDGKSNILLSTTVIEVGVDVKNATCIVIFNAERFGLATLHQLRGRVGRNDLQSRCLLLSDKDSERLKVLTESNDGFYISEQDLKLRGSGDLFGVRQHGDMVFKIANIFKDQKILLQCKKDSEEFINDNIETNFRDYPRYQDIVDELINTH